MNLKTTLPVFGAIALAGSASAQCNSQATACESTRATMVAVIDGGQEDSRSYGSKDIIDVAVEAGSFNTLAAALEAAGLVDALKGDGPFTVFAPTDDAFAKLPEGTVESLLKPENREALVGILTYHVVAGRVPASKVTKLTGAETLNGQRLDIAVDGSTVRVDNATVTATDIKASNGIIHVIDSVIIPEQSDLVSVAASAGSFETLAAALTAAGLVETLQGDGPFTVFAPTDEAFANLPDGTVETLLQPENIDQLKAILLYHVVAGRTYSDAVVGLKKVGTINGADLPISARGGNVKIGNAGLVTADIDASNGVIHVIDTVLLPPSND